MCSEPKKHNSSEQEGKTMSVKKSIANHVLGSTITKAFTLSLGLGLALTPIQMSLAENADEVFTLT